MITTTGNNFGAGAIQINDFQSADLIVLNAKFNIDTTTEEFAKAQVLELYLPELTLNQSSVTSCYIKTEELLYPGKDYEELVQVGTIVKTWIKDSHTLCIEKLEEYSHMPQYTILLATLYAKRGVRGDLVSADLTEVEFNYQTTNMRTTRGCYVNENWAFFCFYYMDIYQGWGEPIVAELIGFPTDISMDIFLLGGGQQTSCPGVYVAEGTISNGVLNIPQTSTKQRDTGSDPFVYVFAVRNKQ